MAHGMAIIKNSVLALALYCIAVFANAEDWQQPTVHAIQVSTNQFSGLDRIDRLENHVDAPSQSDTEAWVQYKLLLIAAYSELNNHEQATRLLAEIAPLLDQVSPTTRVHWLIEQGYIEHIKMSNSSAACSLYSEAYRLSSNVYDPATKVRAISKHAYCLSRSDAINSGQAIIILNEGLKVAREHDIDDHRTALLLSALASAYSNSHMSEAAFKVSREAIEIYLNNDRANDAFNVAFMAFKTAINSDQPEQAQLFLGQLKDIESAASSDNDFAFFIHYLQGLAALNSDPVDLTTALTEFSLAFELRHTTQETFFVLDTLLQLIDVNYIVGNDAKVAELIKVVKVEHARSMKELVAINPSALPLASLVNDDPQQARLEMLKLFNQTRQSHYKSFVNMRRAEAQTSDQLINELMATRQSIKLKEAQYMAEMRTLESEEQQRFLIYGGVLMFATLTLTFYLFYLVHQFKRLANTDGLTKLANRRHIMQTGTRMLEQETIQHGASVVIIDLDHFKNINDSLGHQYGDKVLIEVADVLRGQLRDGDHIGRYGGEEFLAILPNISRRDAIKKAENLRKAIEDIDVSANNLPLTASIGLFHCVDTTSLDIAIAEADSALYRSKTSGRNRVSVAEPA